MQLIPPLRADGPLGNEGNQLLKPNALRGAYISQNVDCLLQYLQGVFGDPCTFEYTFKR